MAVNAWTPLHEPIFIDIEVGIFCSLLQIPRIPREVSFEEIPFTHSNFESMIPTRREQHAAGRFCLRSVINKAEINCVDISESYPLTIQTKTGIKPISISHCDSIGCNPSRFARIRSHFAWCFQCNSRGIRIWRPLLTHFRYNSSFVDCMRI